MSPWFALFFGIIVGSLTACAALGIYGLVLLKRSDDEG